MKARILFLGCAAALSLMAMVGVGPARGEVCSANYCPTRQAACLTGCPCATFTCDPVTCQSSCICPVWCPPES